MVRYAPDGSDQRPATNYSQLRYDQKAQRKGIDALIRLYLKEKKVWHYAIIYDNQTGNEIERWENGKKVEPKNHTQ